MVPERFTTNTTSFANYWEAGVGKDLLEKLTVKPKLEEAKELVPLLFEFDQIADQVVNDFYIKEGFHKGHQIINQCLDKGIEYSLDANESIRRLFNEIEKKPDWLNKDLLEIGSSFCRRTGASSLIVLRDYCLMGGYESAAINKPLIFTGALKKGAVKRLAETLEFWVNITGSKALERNNIGFKSVIKTRMIHSFSRVNILNVSEWKTEKWGIPLNQWDMIATNLGFSLVYLIGLRKIGFNPSATEVEGLFHFWKYVGYLLGIPEKYLANNEDEAIKSLYLWTMTQSAADKDSIALAQALTEEPFLVNFPKYHWSKKMLQQSHLAYNYYFLGEISCQSLHLPRSLFGPVVRLSVLANKTKEYFITNNKQYTRMVVKGRKEQERIRHIYTYINAKKQ
jgi:hypothetical protein